MGRRHGLLWALRGAGFLGLVACHTDRGLRSDRASLKLAIGNGQNQQQTAPPPSRNRKSSSRARTKHTQSAPTSIDVTNDDMVQIFLGEIPTDKHGREERRGTGFDHYSHRSQCEQHEDDLNHTRVQIVRLRLNVLTQSASTASIPPLALAIYGNRATKWRSLVTSSALTPRSPPPARRAVTRRLAAARQERSAARAVRGLRAQERRRRCLPSRH